MEEKKKAKKPRPYDMDESKKIFLYVYEHQLKKEKVNWKEAEEKKLTKHSGVSMRNHYKNSIKHEMALYMEMYPEEVARIFEKVKKWKREERKRQAVNLSMNLTKQGSNISLARISRMNTTHLGTCGNSVLKRMYSHGPGRKHALTNLIKKEQKKRKLKNGEALDEARDESDESNEEESNGSKSKRKWEETMKESRNKSEEPIKKLRTLHNDGVTKQFKKLKLKKVYKGREHSGGDHSGGEASTDQEIEPKMEPKMEPKDVRKKIPRDETGKEERNGTVVQSCNVPMIYKMGMGMEKEPKEIQKKKRGEITGDLLITTLKNTDINNFSDEGNGTNTTTTDSNSNSNSNSNSFEKMNETCLEKKETKEEHALYDETRKNPVTSFFGFIFKKIFH